MPFFGKNNKTPLGIYIHVPFCRSKCQYCDFYSVTEKDTKLHDSYLYAVMNHIKEAGPLAPDYLVDTIYFGGGTPSFFGAEGMAAILAAIRKAFDVAPNAEITFEANPDSVTDKLLKRLRSEGFNRVSLGIQCDDDEILKKIGRPHAYAQAVQAVQRIRKVGFKNLSVDLMYGLPGQTVESWIKTLKHVLKLAPEHISCYGLTLEEGTPLYEYQDYYDLADEDTQADMYLYAVEILRKAGFRQYEISNFCKKGQVSRHNLKYWTGGEYLGFGPNASSDFAGRRFTIIRDLHGYIDGIKTDGQVLREMQQIPHRERAGEYLMMRLRLSSGLDPQEYEQKFLLPFAPLERALVRFKQEGLAAQTFDGRWHLTPRGFLLSNTIISDLLVIQEKTSS
ncbi:MAG: radical SAM family heme chaperone HemW [Oscillospiraceae bacterium]|nr:radical SAM family heme chaperone HemW [Oscillospiraceae bacterium]